MMSILPIASRSIGELAKVKAGLEGGAAPFDYLWWFFWGLLILITISIALNWWRKKRHAAMFRGWTSITEPNRIAAVFKRAAARRASFSLEIFDHQHTNVYQGEVFEIEPGTHIILELLRLPGQDVDFEGFPAQVHLNFRPAPKEAMEHYQFSSHTLAINYQREKNWRVARVAVAWPKSIISAQRRDFLRLEPRAEHSMQAALRQKGESPPPRDLAGLNPIAEGSVLDISIGGIQILVPGLPPLVESNEYLLSLELPLTGLELEMKNPRLILALDILVREVINNAPAGAGGYQNPALGPTRSVIRGRFSGRYQPDPDGGWIFTPFSLNSFQDLAHWVHAYQRYRLKKERQTDSTPPVRPNAFPSVPPVRPKAED
jgi:hypothetical protein